MQDLKIDARLKGLRVSDINLKFVRENATSDELSQTVYSYPPEKTLKSRSTVPIAYDVSVLDGLKKVMEYCRTAVDHGAELSWNIDYDDITIIESLYEDEIKIVTGERAVQIMWKEQVKEANLALKDMEEYLRLKQKLGV